VSESTDPITVVVGQFGALIDRGLRQVLNGDRGLRVLDAGLDHAALEHAVAEHGAQVVVLDEDSAAVSSLPGRLRGARQGVGLVVLAHRPTRAYVKRMVAFGVPVCLATDALEEEIVQGVRLAAGGVAWLSVV